MAKFWSAATVEPKRSWRWVGYINLRSAGKEFGPQPFLVKSFTKPKISLPSDKMINNFTSEAQVITKNYNWENTTVEIFDVQDKELNASSALYKWFKSMGYQPAQSLEKLSKLFTNLQGDRISLTIAQLDHEGKQIETWDFLKPAIISMDFGGSANYESDTMSVITLEFMCTSAQYTNKSTEAKDIANEIFADPSFS